MLARAAELAGVVGDARIDEHAIAGLHVGDTGADGLDHTGAIGADDKRKALGGPRESVRDEEIEMVQRRSANADARLARLRRGCVRHVGDLEVIETAGRGQDTGTHSAPWLLTPNS